MKLGQQIIDRAVRQIQAADMERSSGAMKTGNDELAMQIREEQRLRYLINIKRTLLPHEVIEGDLLLSKRKRRQWDL